MFRLDVECGGLHTSVALEPVAEANALAAYNEWLLSLIHQSRGEARWKNGRGSA